MGVEQLHLRPLGASTTRRRLESASHWMRRPAALWAKSTSVVTRRPLKAPPTLEACVSNEVSLTLRGPSRLARRRGPRPSAAFLLLDGSSAYPEPFPSHDDPCAISSFEYEHTAMAADRDFAAPRYDQAASGYA